DVSLSNRFNVPTANLPQGDIPAPESYGVQSGLMLQAQGRGIGTLPGGIPLYKSICDPVFKTPITLVGGIGVFFPGSDGYATHEQGFAAGIGQTSTQRENAPKALEAEYIAARTAGVFGNYTPGFAFPGGGQPNLGGARIDLVGVKLEIIGPKPTAGHRISGY